MRKHWIAYIVLIAAAWAHADEVILVDGSKLIGRVQSLTAGKVVLETDFAGKIEIDAAKIKGIKTDQPFIIQLNTGDRAVGNLDYTDDTLTIQSEGVGPVTTKLSELTAIWHPGQDSPEVTEVKKKLPIWTARLAIGLDGQTGNTERLTVNGSTWVLRETPDDRLKIYANGRSSKENGNQSIKEVIGGVSLEVDIYKNLFTYGKLELEFDERENLDLRTTVTGGLGYTVIEQPDQTFRVRAGLGFMHETFNDGTNDDQAIAELGEEYRKEITQWLLFNHSITYYPTFDDIGDFRLVMNNAGEIPLNSDKNWKILIGIRNDYNSQPNEGVDSRLDTYYYFNLAWDWK